MGLKASREAQHARAAEKKALEKEGETRAVLEFVEDKILAAARPEGQKGGLGREVTLRKVLEAALPQVETSFQGRPLVEASVHMTLGALFYYLGDAVTAEQQVQIARVRYTARLGVDHPDTLSCMDSLAVIYSVLGRHAEARSLTSRRWRCLKSKLGVDHPNTLRSMANLAASLLVLDRPAEAVGIIDECLRRAAGKVVDSRLMPSALGTRQRAFARLKDASGCRRTAELWEKLNRQDAGSLYDAACYRAVTAGFLRADSRSDGNRQPADAEADKAMIWLTKAVAAGYRTPRDLAHMSQDRDLDALRDRDDFHRLLAELYDRGFPMDPFAR